MRLPRTGGVAALLGLGIGLGLAAPAASAHVSIENDRESPESFAVLHFHVTNEQPVAATVRLEISIPSDATLAYVTPRAGTWTVTMEHRTLSSPIETEAGPLTQVVSKVIFSGDRIEPGMLEIFDVEVGPLPHENGRLQFSAVQTYDDGTVVSWDEPVRPGAIEPARPAAYLDVEDEPTPAGGDDDISAVDIAALVFGTMGFALGVAALRRTRVLDA